MTLRWFTVSGSCAVCRLQAGQVFGVFCCVCGTPEENLGTASGWLYGDVHHNVSKPED